MSARKVWKPLRDATGSPVYGLLAKEITKCHDLPFSRQQIFEEDCSACAGSNDPNPRHHFLERTPIIEATSDLDAAATVGSP